MTQCSIGEDEQWKRASPKDKPVSSFWRTHDVFDQLPEARGCGPRVPDEGYPERASPGGGCCELGEGGSAELQGARRRHR